MQPDSPKLLFDILDACELVVAAVEQKTIEDLRADRIAYAAVERKFEVIGEAINRLTRADPETVA